jgi:phosphoribosyl 1,2-cyclic phosphodiesterase
MVCCVNDFRLQVKFWGVRGSAPTPTAANLGYGGNTTCLEVRSRGGERIIIDAGTGIGDLGRDLLGKGPDESLKLRLFLTHFHWDHIQGLPFFAPLLKPGHQVTFCSFPPPEQTRQRLERLMSNPYFTLDFNSVAAKREFQQLHQETVRYADMAITSFPLHHPQGACGYRIEAEGAVIVVATDVEHGDAALDKELLRQSEGADLLIYDAQYTPAEYEKKRGWGHSTYAAAAQFARNARVKKLLLFHHDPLRNDAAVDSLVEQAGHLFPNVSAAGENCCIDL